MGTQGLAASTITNRVHDEAASCKTKRRPVLLTKRFAIGISLEKEARENNTLALKNQQELLVSYGASHKNTRGGLGTNDALVRNQLATNERLAEAEIS